MKTTSWLPLSFILAGALVAPIVVRAQTFGGLSKFQRYVQTSAAAPAPDPQWAASFEADTDVFKTLTLPDGTSQSMLPGGEGSFLYGFFATKAQMDAAFPNGAYRMSGGNAASATVSLQPESYPVEIPQLVSATNGSWASGGVFVINPTQACTLTFNTFTGYGNPATVGAMYLSLEGVGNSTALDQSITSKAFGDGVVQTTPFTTYVIPANTLTNGRVYTLDLEFGLAPHFDTSGSTYTYTLFSRATRITITAITSGTPPAAPVITAQPASQTGTVGGRATFTITATGLSNNGVQWFHDGQEFDTSQPAGKYTFSANRLQLTINNLTAADAGGYAARLTNTGSAVDTAVAVLTLPVAPQITTQPLAQGAVAGGSVTFSVAASGTGNTYQWRKDGAAIAGATGSTLTLSNLTAANAGSYTVVVTNSAGSTTSSAASLTLVPASAVGRLINLSILTTVVAGGDSFTMGYVVGGAGTSGAKPLVIRAAGPSLSALGVSGVLDDPRLELFAGSTKTGENDNWGGGAELTGAMAGVGAFAFSGPASRDAAALASITSSDNSVKISAAGNGSGAVIAELYDATPAASYSPATPRLINVSVLKNVGTGLTAGFVIGGSTSRTVLVRAIGPTLGAAPFSVPGVIADPQLALFSGQTKIGENNDWGGGAGLSAAFTQVGAFALPAASKDAAVLTTLAPGNYTVQVSSAGTASGIALVEVYEVP